MLVIQPLQCVDGGLQRLELLDQDVSPLRSEVRPHASGDHEIEEVAGPEGLGVGPEQVLLEPGELGEADGESRVVAQRSQVTEVIGHPLALQRQGAQRCGTAWHGGAGDGLQRRAVRPGEGDGRVPGDARCEAVPLALRELLEPPGHPLVGEAQALLEPEHLLAHDREAEAPGLDGAGVNRPHGDLVHSVAGHRDEGVGLGRAVERADPQSRRRGRCLLRPPSVLEPAARITALGDDAQQVGGGTLQPAGHRKASARPGYAARRRRHRVLDDHHLPLQPVCGADSETTVAVPVVGAPQRQ